MVQVAVSSALLLSGQLTPTSSVFIQSEVLGNGNSKNAFNSPQSGRHGNSVSVVLLFRL